MGKASRKKREIRARKATPTLSGPADEPADGADRAALGTEALKRLLSSNTSGELNLAGAYAFGYMLLGYAEREGGAPDWIQACDPLDTLFLGAAFPQAFRDPSEFANLRDAWLRHLRGTAYGKSVQRFVREAVTASTEYELPVDDGELMLAITARLERLGLDRRKLPDRLRPAKALRGTRAFLGPPSDLLLPPPLPDAGSQVEAFWGTTADDVLDDDTPCSILRTGLERLHEAGFPVREEAAFLLPSLYSALLANPGEHVHHMGEHALAWAFSLDERSPLAPVLDTLLLATERGLHVDDTLGHLFAMPAFTEPIPSEALLWTSSPGLALPAVAFDLGITRVVTRNGVITPSELDVAGTRARMLLTDPEDEGAEDTAEGPDADWSERLHAVRESARRRIRKKSGSTPPAPQDSGPPVERVWNADGSSVVRWSVDTPEGRAMSDGLKDQREWFREKFGREPGPDDPLFFDPDADEPIPITEEYLNERISEFADRAPEMGIDPAFFHAWREVGYIVTAANRNMFTKAEILAYTRAVNRHRRAAQ
ncbi:hypothetical protein [Streptomyces parvus]|uniref:Uncharacterized protein n=1 Tax=Streptomyces parvus TaxID=66428 RepID=A0A7K3S7X7_9ACTN|nr:hypothetical protein [Streptomyces parvus]NEC23601.1 hypothetical protein [Streptomyces parvus]